MSGKCYLPVSEATTVLRCSGSLYRTPAGQVIDPCLTCSESGRYSHRARRRVLRLTRILTLQQLAVPEFESYKAEYFLAVVAGQFVSCDQILDGGSTEIPAVH